MLCILVLLGSVTTAYGNTEADTNIQTVYTEDTSFSDLFSNFIESLFFNRKTQIQSKGAVLEVIPPFIIVPLHTKASLFSSIESWIFVWSNVTVLGYDGLFTKVKVNSSEEEGYILKFFLSSDEDFLVKQFENVYVGNSKNILKDYNNPEDFSWSVSQEGIISLDKKTGKITGLKPGTVIVTAKYGNSTDKCIVSSINKWYETESSVAEKSITVKSNPDSSNYDNFTKGTIPPDATIVARGDMADGSGWIYVSDKSEKVWGFIKLSDFSGIDYLMTQYHYYDEGYEERFYSAESKIFDYASVLNDVMMANFKLKVCSYVYPYTSAADKCKKWKYGDDYLDYLSGSCPKTDSHHKESCLVATHIRDAMLLDKGNGTNTITKCVWTGHIMDSHKGDRSHSESTTQSIIFTTGNTVNSGSYTNKSSSAVRKNSIYEIVHETSHQLSSPDHYCYKKDGSSGLCENKNCEICYGSGILPDCIMGKIIYPTDTYDLYCEDCSTKIKNHLNDHH